MITDDILKILIFLIVIIDSEANIKRGVLDDMFVNISPYIVILEESA